MIKCFVFLFSFLLFAASLHANEKDMIAYVSGNEKVIFKEKLTILVNFQKEVSAGELEAFWIDSKDRVCEKQSFQVKEKTAKIPLHFELKAPIGYEHSIRFKWQGQWQSIRHSFMIIYPYPEKWIDYQSCVWAHYDSAYGDLLRQAGITGSIQGKKNVTLQDFAFYPDNIAYEVFAYYHKRRHEHMAMKELWEVKSTQAVVHHRRPSLTDENVYDIVRDRLWNVIERVKDYRPLFYNIADEIGIADQSAVSDLDWEYSNRTAWRNWLEDRYGTLEQLNKQWNTNFSTWAQVRAFFPSTHKIYEKIWVEHLLPKQFPEIKTFQKFFQTSFDNYENFIKAYVAVRNHDAGMVAKGLEDRFKKIEAFNGHFKTDCKDFQQAQEWVARFEKWVAEQNAMDTRNWNLSWWCDWREYMDHYLANGLGKARKIGQEKDAKGIYGITGTHHPGVFNGHHYEFLMDQLDYIMPYNIGESFELLRGLKNDYYFMHPTWQTKDKLKWEVWYQFLHQCRGVLIWDNDEDKHRLIDQKSFILTERGLSAAEAFKEITLGLDQLLFQSKRQTNGIAIYHSQNSARVNWIHQFISLGRKWILRHSWHEYKEDARNTLRTAWIKLIEDNGFQFLFVTPTQLLKHKLSQENIKILILPEVWAMGDEEARMIEKFVADGGTVIADQFTGLYDSHGKRRAEGVLDHAFGISQEQVTGDSRYGNAVKTKKKMSLNQNLSELIMQGVSVGELDTRELSPQAVRVVSDEATFFAGKREDAAMIQKSYGKGMFVFLNVDVSSFGWLRIIDTPEASKQRESLVQLLGHFLGNASGLHHSINNQKTGKRQQGVESAVWDVAKEKQVLGLWRNYQLSKSGIGGESFVDNKLLEQTEELVLKLPSKKYIWNLRTGENYGLLDELALTITPWEPILLCLSEAEKEDFSVDVPKAIKLGEIFECSWSVPLAQMDEKNIFIHQLVNPKGEVKWYYQKDFTMVGKHSKQQFQLAYNDMVGEWKLVTKNIFTQSKKEISFSVTK